MLKPLPLIELETIKREPYPLDCLPEVIGNAAEAITEYVKCPALHLILSFSLLFLAAYLLNLVMEVN